MQDKPYFDVVIVGAGLSGIGMACNLNKRCPGKSFTILERRQRAGGTWDLFRYPGIRSDSDMLTLGYSFRPWKGLDVLAGGSDIRHYVEETAAENNISDKIQFGLKIVKSSFSSKTARWTVEALEEASGQTRVFECNFLVMGTGYYRYDAGFMPEFPGADQFKGLLVHAQKWDENTDYRGKKVVVIGSGATAITLVPAMADQVDHITMLQRSPTYVLSLSGKDPFLKTLGRLLPESLALKIARWRNLARQDLSYKLFKRFPNFSRKLILGITRRKLGGQVDVKHFTPSYNPWDQRLCLVPDSDMFKCLRSGKASVVTDQIDTFTANGIQLKSGQFLEADIVIAATGLHMEAFGGMQLEVDGEATDISERMFYKATLLENIPNFAWIVGYVNASWTLKANIASAYICRVINQLSARGKDYAVPVDHEDSKIMEECFFGALSSNYVKRAEHTLPRQGRREPWRVTMDYRRDQKVLLEDPIEDGVLELRSAEEASKVTPMRRAA